MKTLLHTCCAPCTIYPLTELRKKGHQVTGFFYNPNIHPFQEFQRRRNTLEDFAKKVHLGLEIIRDYGLTDFLREVVFHEKTRCIKCYDMRLLKCAEFAKENGYDAFTTTLLYSRYQNHTRIKDTCSKLANRLSIQFIYDDFRVGWQDGIDQSIALNLYRQPYCGCVYSEQERYDNRLKKQLRKNKKIEVKI